MPDDNGQVPGLTNATAPSLPTVAVPDAPMPDSVVADAPVAPAPVPDPVVVPAAPVNPAAAAAPGVVGAASSAEGDKVVVDTETPAEVARKIGEAHNVLVALSADPSVDEMAAAIGLSLFLDRLGKRATAIYSGATPNALEFLKPEETFEPSVDTLQDFVIALNKEKADHLRYKLDGDYVKIFITPYKSKIAEEDLEFSYGDFNVDLVLALDVANGIDLDQALREHGRIMHDAVIVNITTGNPGKLGEIEWSDKTASSVSEMIAKLLYSVNAKIKIEKEEATAFLTGIVAATNRFSNAGTTPETMRIASKLMESGANQQLVSKNITPDIENEMFNMMGMGEAPKTVDRDPTKLDIEHGNEEGVDETKVVNGTVTEKESTLLNDLKAAEASLAAAGAETTPEETKEPLKIDEDKVTSDGAENEAEKAEIAVPEVATEAAEGTSVDNANPETASNTSEESAPGKPGEGGGGFISNKPEKVIQPPSDMMGGVASDGDTSKYGQMLEDALASVDDVVPEPVASAPIASNDVAVAGDGSTGTGDNPVVGGVPEVPANPEINGVPEVPANPEINGVPEINYMPMPDDAVLPPPPAPPIDMNTEMPAVDNAAAPTGMDTALPPVAPISPSVPVAPETGSLGAQPAMQDQVYGAQAADPSAFKIPGM